MFLLTRGLTPSVQVVPLWLPSSKQNQSAIGSTTSAKHPVPAHLCVDSAITKSANYVLGAGEAEVELSQDLSPKVSRDVGDQSFRSSEGPWSRPRAVREIFQGK